MGQRIDFKREILKCFEINKNEKIIKNQEKSIVLNAC